LKAGIRAGDLVKQILTFSRKQDQELKPLKVGLVIKEVLKLLRSTLPATIKIKSYIDPNCGLALADPTQIHQIIMNLCTNAYHAMNSTGGVLSVNIKPINRVPEDNLSDELFLEPGPYLKLEVSDTGQGISEKNLERIFDPYFTTKKKGEGTGLGLSIVHSIIVSFKGYLDVISSIGKGTTFFIYLPVIEVAGSKSDTFKSSGSLPKGDEKIAFVDDEKSVVDFSKIMLESLGYRVTGFTDSRLVFDTFKSTPDDFDLVITDMTMPHMTGEELARQILEIRPDMPLILCTGYSDHLSSDQAKKIGIRDYIEKPVLKRDLALIIRKILDEKK
jgi:CheY-like chemotaxis protein